MKLNVLVNDIELSGVGETREFKIRNSAKSFKILSDGLYSNKERAIIRELSCNAIDSHVAAGKADVPFELHLPTFFEPWFSVRDFGVGLDDSQMDIYTTYFESTKTDSNDFIGALGLGSKSPFSYTENFTVTTIKNGTRRIYSIFINDLGVPALAPMGEELTDECNGVEIKFSVKKNDFYKFENEARSVIKWFNNQPLVTGSNNFIVSPVEYKEINIIPGVHTLLQSDYGKSYAVMGNIPYPLDNIPDANKHFGSLDTLLGCGIVIEFQIGELDFAASREQLSYIPLTINSIKKKLIELNDGLAKYVKQQADPIVGVWEKAIFLRELNQSKLYKSAIEKYVTDSQFTIIKPNTYGFVVPFKFNREALTIEGLKIDSYIMRHKSIRMITHHRLSDDIEVNIDKNVTIVLNDLKTGALNRSKYHFLNQGDGEQVVHVISHNSPDIKIRQAEYDKIIKRLHNPPAVVLASSLSKKPTLPKVVSSSRGIAILELKANCRAMYADSYKWTNKGVNIDPATKYYYVALDNNVSYDRNNLEFNFFAVKVSMVLTNYADIRDIKIVGVRKSRLAEIKKLKNWIQFEHKLDEEVDKITDSILRQLIILESGYGSNQELDVKVTKLISKTSPYSQYKMKAGVATQFSPNRELVNLCSKFGKNPDRVQVMREELSKETEQISMRYPLLSHVIISRSPGAAKDIADYITMIDKLNK